MQLFCVALSVAIVIFTCVPYDSTGAIRKFEDPFGSTNKLLSKLTQDSSKFDPVSKSEEFKKVNHQRKRNIAVLYDSGGVDKEFQLELVKSVFVAMRELDLSDLNPQFIDVNHVEVPSEIKEESSRMTLSKMEVVSQWVMRNRTSNIVSLLHSDSLLQFVSLYDEAVGSSRWDFAPELTIFTPRLMKSTKMETSHASVKVFSMQMSPRGLATALMNRVEKVGIQTLIPVLDSNAPSQLQFLEQFKASGAQRLKPIAFTKPIFIDDPQHFAAFTKILNDYGDGFNEEGLKEHSNHIRSNKVFNSSTIGVIMLASSGSRLAMKLAAEKKHMQIGWFSPNILQHEEWAYRVENATETSNFTKQADLVNENAVPAEIRNGKPSKEHVEKDYDLSDINPHFGLYSVNYAGSYGWDNSQRRKILHELTSYAGANPRILTSILAYDSAWAAVRSARKDLSFPMAGLSGEIILDEDGYRRDGVFFGVSAVPDLSSQVVTLLQPSTWILEDTIAVTETLERQFLIREYEVSTSTILLADDLKTMADKSKKEVGCVEHIMNIITHDPYNQMAYNYYFKESSLPESLLVPHQHGFGLSFFCIHGESHQPESPTNTTPASQNNTQEPKDPELLTTTLQIACTPGDKLSDPLKCFRSDVQHRQKRSSSEVVPQYQYGVENRPDWYQVQYNRWSEPKQKSANDYYYQSPNHYTYGSTTPAYIRRQDTSVSAAAEVSTTPAPSPTSKLPELRQILKAAKPFVGSCVGSTTGCAMCVLVLGRLPLGAVPAACTGPCFVGTFGSCGSLLGRVFSETTVICTELFKQGYIDMETFLADSAFGRVMQKDFPNTLLGYQILATPLVEAMKRSTIVTDIVATFALPWAQHMRHMMGTSNEPSLLGMAIHTLGFPLCTLIGNLYTIYTATFSQLPSASFALTLILILITLFLSTLKRYSDNENPCLSKEGAQTCSVLRTILGTSQDFVRHVFS